MKSSLKFILIPLFFLFIAREASPSYSEIAKSGDQINLLNPIFKYIPEKKFIEIKNFKHKIVELIEAKKKTGELIDAAIYFRDLDNGPWFGVNERAQFAPASLIKIPIMMAWLKEAEQDHGVLTREVQFINVGMGGVVKQNIIDKHALKEGNFYTIDELLLHMIAYSNNYAYDFLFKLLNKETLEDVFVDMGYSIPQTRTPHDYISVKEYGALFRALYNSSYLSKEMSQRALNYLVKSDFSDGIVAGLPKGLTAAHKFGERAYQDIDLKELHEFAIVYYPTHPYLLGIMTQGKDFGKLKKALKDFSALIYKEVNSQLAK